MLCFVIVYFMVAVVFFSNKIAKNSRVLSPGLLYSCFGCLHLITLGSDEGASIFVFEMRGFKRHLSGTAFPKKQRSDWSVVCAGLHSWPLNITLVSATLVISTPLMLASFSRLLY